MGSWGPSVGGDGLRSAAVAAAAAVVVIPWRWIRERGGTSAAAALERLSAAAAPTADIFRAGCSFQVSLPPFPESKTNEKRRKSWWNQRLLLILKPADKSNSHLGDAGFFNKNRTASIRGDAEMR